MLTGENGILYNTTKARKENALSAVKEQVLIAVNTAYTEYHAKEVTKKLEENETFYNDTKDALMAIVSNKSDVKYSTDPGKDDENKDILKITLKYKDETTVIEETLNADGSFKWN